MSANFKCWKCGAENQPTSASPEDLAKAERRVTTTVSASPEALADAAPRDQQLNKAGIELWEWVGLWSKRHNLNTTEHTYILIQAALVNAGVQEDNEIVELINPVREYLCRRGDAEKAKAAKGK